MASRGFNGQRVSKARTRKTDRVAELVRRRVEPWRLGAVIDLCGLSDVHSALGGSVAEWLACWTQAQKGPGSNRSRDAVG